MHSFTFSSALKYFVDELESIYSNSESRSIGKLFFEDSLGLTSSDLILKGNDVLDESVANKMIGVVGRLKMNEPIQYILGKAWFRDKQFDVNSSVLIPRGETEELIQWIIDENKCHAPNILDIGTGSGCIAISLATEVEHAQVEAWDISSEALTVAMGNAKKNNANVVFKEIDVLQVSVSVNQCFYDVIVSNPPYVRLVEKDLMHANVVKYEPHLALFVNDNDPLIFYRHIARLSQQMLQKGGWLYFEINEALGNEMILLLSGMGYVNVVVKADLHGKERMLRAQLPNL